MINIRQRKLRVVQFHQRKASHRNKKTNLNFSFKSCKQRFRSGTMTCVTLGHNPVKSETSSRQYLLTSGVDIFNLNSVEILCYNINYKHWRSFTRQIKSKQNTCWFFVTSPVQRGYELENATKILLLYIVYFPILIMSLDTSSNRIKRTWKIVTQQTSLT